MRLHKPLCPHCGKPAIGACDFTPGIAGFIIDEDDPAAVEYDGHTEMHWDGQFNAAELATADCADEHLRLLPDVPQAEQMQVACDNGHEWIKERREEEAAVEESRKRAKQAEEARRANAAEPVVA